MKKNIIHIADYHMHTSFSEDSTYPMIDAIQQSIAMNIDEICFTEHVDYGVPTAQCCDYHSYLKEYERCKELYKDQINIKFGIEFGVQAHTIPQYKKDFSKYPFDFVICSIHQVDDKEFWNQDFQEGKTQEEYQKRYYEEMLYVVENFDEYSVLGHLDMIQRYDKQGYYPFENVKEIITSILKRVIQQGKGIEVNTSCYRYGLTDMTPSKDILKLYKSLGGTILTIGSDSHQEDHVGFHIQETKEILKDLGFTSFCTFDKGKAIHHSL